MVCGLDRIKILNYQNHYNNSKSDTNKPRLIPFKEILVVFTH